MTQKWIVIVNPAAGSGKAKRKWPEVQRELEAVGLQYEMVQTTEPGNAIHIVKKGMENGFYKFISVGGDGTHHEVVNGICQQGGNHSKCRLAILPIGTGNDWARSLGISRNLRKAVDVIVNGKCVNHSAGLVHFDNGRMEFFMNVAGMCMDAAVVQNVDAQTVNKFGGLAYLIGGVRELFRYNSPEVMVAIDGDTITGRNLTMHAGFGRYCGGGMQFLPHAESTGANLAITTVSAENKMSLFFNIHRLFTGTIHDLKTARSYSAPYMSVNHIGDIPVPIEADGEFLGFSPFEISAIHDALLVCVP